MRYVVIACLLCCCTLSGCSWMSDYESARQSGYNSINLWPTDKEVRAGER